MYKIVSRICNVLAALILVVILMAAGVLAIPRLFGYNMFAVLSGSMEPHFHVGSIVYVDTKISPEDVQVGDPITFHLGDSAIATHRVIGIDAEQRQFTTKGDANEVEDLAPVSFDSLMGKATFSIPYLGYVTLNIKTKKGIFTAVAVLVVLIILYLIPEILKPEGEEEAQDQKRSGKKTKK